VSQIKQALILQGGPASVNGQKCRDWGITRLFWEARDPNATVMLLKGVRAAGIGVGLMRDPSWTNYTAPQLAVAMDKDLTDHGFGSTTGPDSCAAMFDFEGHNAQYAIDMLKRWRQLRPTRTTLWTLESGQGGWFTNELADLINHDPNLLIVPQFYLGTPRLYPVDSRWSVGNLTGENSDDVFSEKVVGFYDAEARMPYGWNGLVYNFNALPAKPEIPL